MNFLVPAHHVTGLPIGALQGSGGGGGSTFTDDFNRANENLDDSADWTLQTGTDTDLKIVSNQINRANTSATTICTAPDTGSADHYAEFYQNSPTFQNLGNSRPSLIARFQDTNNFAFVAIGNSGQGYTIYKRVAGVDTSLGSYSPRAQGETVRFEANGGNVRLLVGGSEVIAATSLGGDLSTGTLVGIGNANAGVGVFDDWESAAL